MQGLPLLHSLDNNLLFLDIFDDGHSDRCEVISHCGFNLHFLMIESSFGGSDGKEAACNAEDLGSIPGSGRSLEKGMATHSSILAWGIP